MFTGKLGSSPTGGLEEVWSTLTGALREARQHLPLVPEGREKGWVMDKVREASRKKQEDWLRWVKSPGCDRLKRVYEDMKLLSRKCAD